MIRKELLGNLVAKSDSFLVVEVSNVVIFVVYFLINYCNDMSERKFSLTCTSIAKLVSKYEHEGLSFLLFGDLNCELSDAENNRSQILLLACPSLTYVGNDRDFTYIHQSRDAIGGGVRGGQMPTPDLPGGPSFHHKGPFVSHNNPLCPT